MWRIISKRKCVQESLINLIGILVVSFFLVVFFPHINGLASFTMYYTINKVAVLSLTAQPWCPGPEWTWLHNFWCLTSKWIWHNGNKKSLQLIPKSVSSACFELAKSSSSLQTRRSAATEDQSWKLRSELNWDGEKDATTVITGPLHSLTQNKAWSS